MTAVPYLADENQLQFLGLSDIRNKLCKFLDTTVPSATPIKQGIAELLLTLTESELSRRKLMAADDTQRLLGCLFAHIEDRTTEVTAMSIVNNLALTSK